MPVYNHIPKVEDDMQGATETEAGKAGLVPVPEAGDTSRALMSDGTWKIPPKAKNTEKLCGLPLYDNKPINTDVEGVNKDIAIPVVHAEFGGRPQIAIPRISIIDRKENSVVENLFGALEVISETITHEDGREETVCRLVLRALSDNKYGTANMSISGENIEIEGDNISIKKRSSTSDDTDITIEVSGDISASNTVNSETDVSAATNVCGGVRVISGAKSATEITKQMRMGAGTLIAYAPSETGDKLTPVSFRLGGKADALDLIEEGISELRLSTCCATNDNNDAPALVPIVNKKSSLGLSNYLWKQLYASTTTISTSDRNLKEDINPFTKLYEKLFFDLQPSTFKFKDGESGRTHTGFISQDVEKALEKNDLSALDFAGFCKDQKTETVVDENGKEKEIPIEGEYIYSLRYEEFIALNTHMIQKLYDKIENLEKKLKENGIEV